MTANLLGLYLNCQLAQLVDQVSPSKHQFLQIKNIILLEYFISFKLYRNHNCTYIKGVPCNNGQPFFIWFYPAQQKFIDSYH